MFFKDEFLEWIHDEFPSTLDNHWNWDLLENIIDYAIKEKNKTKEQFVDFLWKIIPEVSKEEIEKFYC